MKTTPNTAELLAYCEGLISDPDPNTGYVMFDEFICDSGDGDGTIADPGAFDPWGGPQPDDEEAE